MVMGVISYIVERQLGEAGKKQAEDKESGFDS
jgi:hypothetical protein